MTINILTTLTCKEYWCDLIGVYRRFSSSRLEYAGAARSFSAIVQVVSCPPMLQLVTSNVRAFVDYFYEKKNHCEVLMFLLLFCRASDCLPYGLHIDGRTQAFILAMFFITSAKARTIFSWPPGTARLKARISRNVEDKRLAGKVSTSEVMITFRTCRRRPRSFLIF